MGCTGSSGDQQKGKISALISRNSHFWRWVGLLQRFQYQEDTHLKTTEKTFMCFFIASQTWGLFPTSPFTLLSDLRRTFCLTSIISCLPIPFKNSGFDLSHAVFVSSLAWVAQIKASGCCCSVATLIICHHPSKSYVCA